jgi:hypothetical protein
MPQVSTGMRRIGLDGELRLPVGVAAGILGVLVTACTTPSRHLAVTSGADGTVVALDGELRTMDTVPVPHDRPGQPIGASLAYDGTTLFVARATATAGTVERARLADGAVLDRVDFYAGAPVIVHPLFDGRTVMVVTIERSGSSMRATLHFMGLDLSSQTSPIPVCGTRVLGLATVRPNDRVYLLCDGDRVVEVDRRLRTLITTVDLPRPTTSDQSPCGASDIGIASTGSIVFALCAETGRLLYLDRVSLDAIDSLDVGYGGQWLVRAPDGQHVVVGRPDRREVVVADVRRRVIVGRIATEYAPLAAVVGADSRTAYVATGIPRVPGRLLHIDLQSAAVRRDVPTVPMPITLSAWPGEESPAMRWDE